MTGTQVRFVRHVAFRVPEVDASARYLSGSWGLVPTADGSGFGTTPEARPLVKLSEGPARGIDHISLGTRDRKGVDAAAERVQRLGLSLDRDPGVDEEGLYSMRCRDAAGLVLEVAAVPAVPTGTVEPTVPSEPIASAEPTATVESQGLSDRPTLISHVVVNTPDLEETSKLYCELFGFEVSDRYGDFMTFLRCNRFHHSLAFSRADHTSINHVAFEMGSIDAVMRGTSRLKRLGQEAIWGPGRHGPGDNVFAYFVDPNGLLMEYTSGLEIFDEGDPRDAKVWAIGDPASENLWGTGDPSDDAAAAMWGEPDPYLRPA